MPILRWWGIVQESAMKWWMDNAFRLGASLSFYTAFALSPVLITVIAIAGLVFGQEPVQRALMEQISRIVGPESAAAMNTLLATARPPGHGLAATAISIVTVLVLATGVVVEMQDGLNTIWNRRAQNGSGVWRLLRDRVLSLLFITGMAFLLLVSLVIDAVLAAVGTYLGNLLPASEVILGLLNLMISVAVVTVLFAAIFRVLPNARVAWKDVWVGAGLTTLLFTIGKVLIGVYLGTSGVTSAYGAASSVMVILLWVYYSALIFYFGAEFTYVYARKYGASSDLK